MVRDMTKGHPMRVILLFFVPLFLGNLFQQFYSAVDSVIVGRYVGVDAFAGITSTGSINFLILGFMMGMNAGFSIPIAQSFGAGEKREMRRYFANSLILGGIFSFIMTIIVVLLTRRILIWIGTPENIFEDAYHYIIIIFAGMMTMMLYNLASAALRAVGNSRTPLYFLIFSCLLNIVLDFVLVVFVHMGVAGAALATVIAQLIAGVLCLLLIFKKYDELRVRRDEWRPEAKYIKRLLNMGIPMGLQFSITAIGSIVIQSAVNSLGSDAVAAIGVGAKCQFLFTCAMETMGTTMATYTGQNLGAKRIDRIRLGIRWSTLVMLIYSVISYFGLNLVGRYLIYMFIGSGTPDVTKMAMQYLSLITLFFPLLMLIMIYRNTIQGLGFSKIAMFAGLFEMVGRSFVAFYCVPKWGFTGAIWANPVAWVMADILLIPVYFWVMKRVKANCEAKQ